MGNLIIKIISARNAFSFHSDETLTSLSCYYAAHIFLLVFQNIQETEFSVHLKKI